LANAGVDEIVERAEKVPQVAVEVQEETDGGQAKELAYYLLLSDTHTWKCGAGSIEEHDCVDTGDNRNEAAGHGQGRRGTTVQVSHHEIEYEDRRILLVWRNKRDVCAGDND